ncbi:MAG: SPOR domain-containing protein, partial [Alphaproteobacteria bacterium]|nr:SPOR domain-containing protein [Alphaproteobacteria bacterium]
PLPGSPVPGSPVVARGPATVLSAAAREATKEAQTDTPVTVVPTRGPNQIYVQAGAFANANNALRLQSQLQTTWPTTVNAAIVQGQNFYRVRVGPLASVEEADRTLERLLGSGHQQARVVVD